MKYILASASERRQELLNRIIDNFDIIISDFDEEKVREKVKNTSINNPKGCTSIRADLRDGRKTEVDTISGAVVRAAHKHGVEVPGHECIVRLVHAMEGRNK